MASRPILAQRAVSSQRKGVVAAAVHPLDRPALDLQAQGGDLRRPQTGEMARPGGGSGQRVARPQGAFSGAA